MYIIPIISMLILIGIDQFTKYLTLKNIMPVGSIPIIGNFFSLTYVENRGAAFGAFQGGKWIFIIIAVLVLIFGAMYYKKLVDNAEGILARIALVLVGSGAIGNVIDRLFRNYVVDMLDFNILGYDFPVFNFADICVCVGAALLIVSVLFSKEK